MEFGVEYKTYGQDIPKELEAPLGHSYTMQDVVKYLDKLVESGERSRVEGFISAWQYALSGKLGNLAHSDDVVFEGMDRVTHLPESRQGSPALPKNFTLAVAIGDRPDCAAYKIVRAYFNL